MVETAPQTAYGLVIEGETLVVTRTRQPGFFDPRFLVAALLDHVARGDGEVCEDETVAMVELLAAQFGLDTRQAQARLGHALNLYGRTMDLPTVGSLLAEVLGDDERIDVMSMLLGVAAADGRRRADELAAVDEVADALSLTEAERHAGFERYFEQQAPGRKKRRIHRRRQSGL